MGRTVLFVDVDTQRDFMEPGGALYVPGAERLVENVRRLVSHAAEHGLPLLSSADAHTPDDPELRRFPPHCMDGSPGAEKIPGTLLEDRAVVPAGGGDVEAAARRRQVVLQKRAFDVFTNPAADALVRRLRPDAAVVFGVATDYCVRAAVLGLRARGVPVTVVTDAIAPVTPEGGDRAIAEMRERGARFASTDEALRAAW